MPEHMKAIFNKLLLVTIISCTLLIPAYIGTVAGFTMGHRFMLSIYKKPPPSIITYVMSASNPLGILKGYSDIHKQVSYYKQDERYRVAYFNAAFDTKFYRSEEHTV